MNTDRRQRSGHSVAIEIVEDFVLVAEIENSASCEVRLVEILLLQEHSMNSVLLDSEVYFVVSFLANVSCIAAIIDVSAVMWATVSSVARDLAMCSDAPLPNDVFENLVRYNARAICCSSCDSVKSAIFLVDAY